MRSRSQAQRGALAAALSALMLAQPLPVALARQWSPAAMSSPASWAFAADASGSPATAALAEPVTVVQQVGQTDFRQAWLRASPTQRIRFGEQIGEEGGMVYAASRGYRPILAPLQKTYPQGFDQVYLAPNGQVVVFEIKGGTAHLNRGYGYIQGTPEWAVEGAARILRSTRCSPAERAAALRVLQAARDKSLRVEVVRTRHALGRPGTPQAVKVNKATDQAARLADRRLKEMDPRLKAEASAVAGNGWVRFAKRGGKVLLITTVISGAINGASYWRGDITAQDALTNVAVDDASAGTAWLATEGMVYAVGEKVVLAVNVGAGTGVAYFVFTSTRNLLNALRGNTNPNDLPEQLRDNGIKALATGVVTGVIIGACANPGTATIVLVSLGVVITVEYAYSKIKPLFERDLQAHQAYYARLPASFRQVSPVEWVRESRALEGFGKTYGPRIAAEPGKSPADLARTEPAFGGGVAPSLW